MQQCCRRISVIKCQHVLQPAHASNHNEILLDKLISYGLEDKDSLNPGLHSRNDRPNGASLEFPYITMN